MITQGKWEIRYAECPIIVAVDIEPVDIAHLDFVPNGNSEVQANARLIAAAPDLSHELKQADKIIAKLVDMVRDRRQTVIPELRNAQREAALSKAEG